MNYELVPYRDDIDVWFDDNDDPWMSQAEMARLFGVSVPNVNKMLSYAFRSGDLDENSVFNLRLKAADGKFYNVKHYHFDAILIVGFRTKATNEALAFRQWVSWVVRSHLHEMRRRLNQALADLDETRAELAEQTRHASYVEADYNDLLSEIYSDAADVWEGIE